MNSCELHAYLLEDNPDLREALVDTLQELTCVRVIASSHDPSQAASWLSQHTRDWDLLVVDLLLPGESGLHLVQRLPARAPWQKVVLLSNYATASVRKRSAQLGIDAVFDKSTQVDALVDYCTRLFFLRDGAMTCEVSRTHDAAPQA